VVVWTSVPLVPVTVMVYLCAGCVSAKPPPHAVRAVKAPSEANTRAPSVILRWRRLPGRKSRPMSASAGAASGHAELCRADAVVVDAV